MRTKLSRQLLVCILSLTLVLTIGMHIQSSYNESAQASPAERLFYPEARTESSPVVAAAIVNKKEEPKLALTAATKTAAEPAESAEPAKPEDPKPAFHTYEVTAYYLNVRVHSYNTSEIQTVVKKGTLLEIIKTTDNGWLMLKNGGYVHGGYAKLVSSEEKSSSKVKALSAEVVPTLRYEAAKAQPQPAVVKRITAEPGKLKYTVKSDSGLTEEHIAAIFKGTALAGIGLEEAILEIEDKYGINAYFTIAVMKLESGNGKSKLAKSKNNLFGLNAVSGDEGKKASSFKTKGDSVRRFGQLISKNYVGKGYTTIDKVATKYCPANSKWPSLVKNIMKRDNRKLLY